MYNPCIKLIDFINKVQIFHHIKVVFKDGKEIDELKPSM